MNRTILTVSLLLVAGAAEAQEFNGKCTSYRAAGQVACEATQWCHWVQPKQTGVIAPNGKAVTTAAFCAFKPGFKAAYASK
jgi:hypothetical protein